MKNILTAVGAYEVGAGPIAPGETVRMNHADCPAGEDTRRRLYITAKYNAGSVVYLGYCHNCADGGVANDNIPRVVPAPLVPSTGVSKELCLPVGCVPLGEAPSEARDWLGAHFSIHDAERLGIQWDTESQRVVLPIWSSVMIDSVRNAIQCVGPLRGYQLRRIFGNGPKYLSVRGDNPMETLMERAMIKPVVFVVEDFLSAWTILRVFACASVPLLGVHIRAERLAKLVKNYERVVVWLDNDNPTVKAHADHLARLVKAMGGKACVVPVGQAKDLPLEDVRQAAVQALKDVS